MSKQILVVEDQEDNRQIVRDLLTTCDYEITEAENAARLYVGFLKSPDGEVGRPPPGSPLAGSPRYP